MQGYFVDGVLVACLKLDWLHALDWNLHDTIAQCECKLAQTKSHTDSHKHTNKPTTLLNDVLAHTAQIKEADKSYE